MPTAGRGSARAAIGQWGGGRHSLVDRLCGWWVVSSEGPRQARGACLGGRSFCGRVPVAAAKRNDKQAGRRDGEKGRTGRGSRAVAGEKRGGGGARERCRWGERWTMDYVVASVKGHRRISGVGAFLDGPHSTSLPHAPRSFCWDLLAAQASRNGASDRYARRRDWQGSREQTAAVRELGRAEVGRAGAGATGPV